MNNPLGRACYEAAAVGDGRPLPSWDDLPASDQQQWNDLAEAERRQESYEAESAERFQHPAQPDRTALCPDCGEPPPSVPVGAPDRLIDRFMLHECQGSRAFQRPQFFSACNCTCPITGAHDPDCAVYGPPPETWGAATGRETGAMSGTAQADVINICENCRRTIHTHKPSHMPDKSACWVHDDTGMHECGMDFGESDEMAEPILASLPEPDDITCGQTDEEATR